MIPVHILPVLIMLESFGAAIFYAIAGNWGTAIYWFCGGMLNLAVTFLIPGLG